MIETCRLDGRRDAGENLRHDFWGWLQFIEIMRLDSWLWAVRAFKTRPLAVAAIKGGKVKVEDLAVKPACTLREGQTIKVQIQTSETPWVRTLRVVAFPSSRVGAKLVPQYAEDLTSAEELEKSKMRGPQIQGFRPRGSGRPTKVERRAIEELLE